MTRADIERIVKSCGYSLYFSRQQRHSAHKRGGEGHYVYVYCKEVKRSLGTFEVVAQMSEDVLRKHVAAKFAQGGH